jgi:hypothetical protein
MCTDDEGNIDNATWKDEPIPPRMFRLLEKVCDLLPVKINGVKIWCSRLDGGGEAFYVMPGSRENFTLYWRNKK